jgi:hypothetical protein
MYIGQITFRLSLSRKTFEKNKENLIRKCELIVRSLTPIENEYWYIKKRKTSTHNKQEENGAQVFRKQKIKRADMDNTVDNKICCY